MFMRFGSVVFQEVLWLNQSSVQLFVSESNNEDASLPVISTRGLVPRPQLKADKHSSAPAHLIGVN